MLISLLIALAVALSDDNTQASRGQLNLPMAEQATTVGKLLNLPWWDTATAVFNASLENSSVSLNALGDISAMLHANSAGLQTPVINKVITILQCAFLNNVVHNQILTIIDYSLPSNEKRLWVFDLQEKKLLFHTYVSHGITSGTLLTNFFSNKFNSKATSLGVYKTNQTYYGRDGLSLRLQGLDSGLNDNASNRYIVMHGGWYVSEEFIKKYGRPGRSWGCPAIPEDIKTPLINAIKENSLFVAYYPNDQWFLKSRFLNCSKIGQPESVKMIAMPKLPPESLREEVLFTGLGKASLEGNDAILVMSADNYQRIFHNNPPLARMLRRQISQMEYVALSKAEFETLVAKHAQLSDNERKAQLETLNFVVPVIKMIRGYYETQMQIVDTGKVIGVNRYVVATEKKPALPLRATNKFIRWLGL